MTLTVSFVHYRSDRTAPTRPVVHELIAVPVDAGDKEGVIAASSDVREQDVQRTQVGAIRWSQGTHEVDLLYVQPSARRQGVATALWRAATGVHFMSTGRRLTVSARRTALGELWVRSVVPRAEPIVELMAPMTTRADAQGVHAHVLRPDDVAGVLARTAHLQLPSPLVRAYCEATFEASMGAITRASGPGRP
ncbi:GNAT family N-acetyltransferase [Nocardiopsis dassonvillei]|uniref:GNAT family N-acetyltransferase n=1 Tax=Nocardiopsis dassonvillei TaxID=2014 RepID=UPI0020100DB5|nr:GNAT family N-acetyltransferase [Nocardiopsis dassonvillei]MCK9874122.1 GNAT family N-acetyltransferase [Nocardiopsis dassonvillei]